VEKPESFLGGFWCKMRKFFHQATSEEFDGIPGSITTVIFRTDSALRPNSSSDKF
jgi:hypothetical protein